MRKLMVLVGMGIAGIGLALGAWMIWGQKWVEPRGRVGLKITNNLEKYDFDSLKRDWEAGVYGYGTLVVGDKITEVETRRNKVVSWQTAQIEYESGGKKITGMMNYWPDDVRRPAIIMVRGYAEKAGYYSGSGSWRMADVLAQAGMVTVSLDFLGYGGSEEESTDMMEARFEKVGSLLDLVGAVRKLPGVEGDKIGFWAHSNGGQITLSALEVLGGYYPSVLWAPMTQKFPDSILETSADLEDGGRAVRRAVETLAKYHDPRRYAFEKYYEWVNSPVLIFQGTEDEWCEVEWQRKVVGELTNLGKEAELRVIEGAGHNMEGRGGEIWKEVAQQTVDYFRNLL